MYNEINFFYELGALRHLKRSYCLNVLTNTESVAEHSYRVGVISYILSGYFKVDVRKIFVMALLHDMAEIRTGDSNWAQKPYLKILEEKAINAQLKNVGVKSNEIKALLDEYHERKSLEAQIVKDADYLDYLLSLKELELQGNLEAKRRLKSENTSLTHFYTSKAKKLAKQIKKTNPTDWSKKDLLITHNNYKV